jgi:uncharacterized protein YndB with AHSA1/START domain
MKLYKKILIGVAALIAIPFIAALFTKKDFVIEKQIVINKPKQEVFDYVKLVKNQENYTVWTKADPNVKMEYTGTDGTVGFTSAWKSDNKDVGVGKQEITKVVEGERLEIKVTFYEPFEGVNDAYTSFEEISPSQTKVVNGFKGERNYIARIICLFMNMDKMVGDPMQQNLNNLKALLEK